MQAPVDLGGSRHEALFRKQTWSDVHLTLYIIHIFYSFSVGLSRNYYALLLAREGQAVALTAMGDPASRDDHGRDSPPSPPNSVLFMIHST